MVAPIAPEGGWKKWFQEHQHQRTKYPVLREADFTAVWQESEVPPTSVANYDVVEMWYDGADGKLYARLNDLELDWLWVSGKTNDVGWDSIVTDLFEHVISQKPATPPVPVGTGWDDLDWSK